MAKCNYCGATIIMGGVRAGELRFCNNKCHHNAYVLTLTKTVPAEILDQHVEKIWRGQCPKCGGAGPVDVHRIHEVWSALFLTRWVTKTQVSCRGCATRRQLGGIAFSTVCGWWGFPWGLILTPVQITRNIVAMSSGPSKSQPSADLRKLALVNIGNQVMANSRRATTGQVPPRL